MVTFFPGARKAYYGVGASEKIGEEMAKLGCKKVLVVYDQGVKNAGIIEPIVSSLKNAGLAVEEFGKVMSDPPDYIIDEGGEFAREKKVDGFVGVGGGSSIDTAKGINVLMNNEPPINNWFAPNPIPGPALPLIAIPTTAGTGSEVTGGGVVTDTRNHVGFKAGVFQASPDLAIIDPVLYTGMPHAPSVCCAVDALTHCVDSLVSNAPDPIGGTFGAKGISLIAKNLPKLEANPKDVQIRGNLALSAYFGGTTMGGSNCHLTHVVGHTIGTLCHIPHGAGCGLALPQLFRWYAKWLPEETKKVAEAWGISFDENISPEGLGNLMHDEMLKFFKLVKFPTFTDLKLTKEKAVECAKHMPNDVCMMFSPKPGLGVKDFEGLMAEAFDEYC
ncbi:MAG: iron-containing alcohol dehydrogenase [Synergistaceae bacterium]|nr:iron-containing alcohol dehydrogenase [Synergistaceae bacterium]